jgi:acyl carrier protein
MTEISTLHQQLLMLFETNLNVEVPSLETDLFESRLLDSMGLVELVASLEQQFGIVIAFDTLDLDHFRSVGSIASLVSSLVTQA